MLYPRDRVFGGVIEFGRAPSAIFSMGDGRSLGFGSRRTPFTNVFFYRGRAKNGANKSGKGSA